MKQDALEELHHEAFALAVRDVLEDDPAGLRSVARHQRLHEAHRAPPMRYLHVQRAELRRASEIVVAMATKRYVHPTHAPE